MANICLHLFYYFFTALPTKSHAANLRQLVAQAQADAASAQDKPVNTFKDYAPGFVRVGIKYLPQMPDEQQRR